MMSSVFVETVKMMRIAARINDVMCVVFGLESSQESHTRLRYSQKQVIPEPDLKQFVLDIQFVCLLRCRDLRSSVILGQPSTSGMRSCHVPSALSGSTLNPLFRIS